MAILIDPPVWPAHGTLWSHLVSDTDYDELHAFASRLRVPRRGFDLDHYDVPASLYEQALRLGARPVTAKDIVFRLRDAGLRVRQADRHEVLPIRRQQFLVDEWKSLGELLGTTDSTSTNTGDDWGRLGAGLLARWNEPHRRYHDKRHLEDVLLALDQLALRGEEVSPATLLAAWFHDAVYAGKATDEIDSARLAVEHLSGFGLAPGLVSQVGEYIAATAPAFELRDPVAPLAHLLDADLSIFAASPQRYEEYTVSVRAEYAHLTAADFAAGRAKILTTYLERTSIYHTEPAQQLWDQRARRNLQREVTRLHEA